MPTIDDAEHEGKEYLSLKLSNPTNAAFRTLRVGYGDKRVEARINDNDDPPPAPVVSFASEASSAQEDTGTHNVAINLSRAPTVDITLNYRSGGTASSAFDYGLLPPTISVPSGATSVNIPVRIIDDSVEDGGETIVLILTAGKGYTVGSSDRHTLTIQNHETVVPTVMIARKAGAASAISEGGTAAFTVTTDQAPSSPLTVSLEVSETQGSDFVAAGDEGTQTVTVPADGTEATFEVATVGDTTDEPDGSVTVTLAAASGYRVSATEDSATVAVQDDDPPPAAQPLTVTLAAERDTIAEANGETKFTVSLSRALESGESAVVPFTVTGARAHRHWSIRFRPGDNGPGVRRTAAGHDSAVTFTEGGRVATLVLIARPNDDAGDRTVGIAFGSGERAPSAAGVVGGITPMGSPLAVTIADDEPLTVALGAARKRIAEANGETKFTVSLSRALRAGETATVPFTITGGRAHAHWNIRFRPGDNGPGVKRTATGHDSVVTFTEGGQVATLVLIARPNDDNGDRMIGVAFGTGERAPRATGVAGGITPVGSPLAVTIVDDDALSEPTLTVADARSKEKRGFIRFTIRRSEPAGHAVRVHAETRESTPVSARSGSDYTSGSFDVRFGPGETLKHVRVALHDDSHDEDPETFELVLSDARGAAIADGVAVGTIVNSDPLPAAWLKRFGRTVAEQALDGITGRMVAPRTEGFEATLAGQALGFGPAGALLADNKLAPAMAKIARGFDRAADGIGGTDPVGNGFGTSPEQFRTMTAGEALLGSSFSLTGGKDGAGGSLAFWGRASQGNFDGAERGDGTDITLDGTVTTGMLGADYARGNWLIGLALTQSTSEGKYASEGDPGCPAADDGTVPALCDHAVRAGDGDVEASLAAAIPYAALRASERLKLWGAAGYGTGEVTLKTMGESYKADTSWTMAAAGVRGDLLEAPQEGSGPALALTSDALWARTSSDKTGELAATDSDVTRLRLGLEGSYRIAMEGDSHLTPKLEVGARHDGGDAETGFGVEVGGGIAWVDPSLGLSLDVSGRTLLAHENDDLKDRGFSAALGFDPAPATQRGPSFSLRQDFGGQAQGGLDALFANASLEDRTGSEAASRWAMEAAYGLPVFGDRFTGSPHVGLGLATGARDYSLGWRLTPEAATAPDLSFGVRATRRESDTAEAEHTVGFEVNARW
ncbi:MAG: hypothetical protein OXP75_16930 [Rhodospirillales bacterium]|nr:hypothetical protein [Rhodospirillales bacterium]